MGEMIIAFLFGFTMSIVFHIQNEREKKRKGVYRRRRRY